MLSCSSKTETVSNNDDFDCVAFNNALDQTTEELQWKHLHGRGGSSGSGNEYILKISKDLDDIYFVFQSDNDKKYVYNVRIYCEQGNSNTNEFLKSLKNQLPELESRAVIESLFTILPINNQPDRTQ